MPKPYVRARNAAFEAQGGRCHYCLYEMWLHDAAAFIATHKLTKRQVRRFQCTGEHLVAQRDGGTHVPSNIVAACRHCNLIRHRPIVPDAKPETYLEWVRSLVANQRWHPVWARHISPAQRHCG